MNPNRVVALLTPVFAGLAGFIAQAVSDNFPGAPALDQGELTAIFIAVAASVVAVAWKWLEGWQQHEEREALADEVARIPDLPQ